MSKISNLYRIRDYELEDTNFILATFLRGLYYGNEFYGLIPKHLFMENYKTVVENFIKSSVIKVACLEEDPGVVLGFSILSKDSVSVHWLYVKQIWRNQGIGKSLLPPSALYYSHFTTLGLGLAKKRNMIFNPFRQ